MFEKAQIIATAKTMFRQFMKFGAVGVMNTTIYYTLFLIFLNFVHPTIGYYLASFISMIFAVLMNLRFTFEKQPTARKITAFIGVYLVSMNIGGVILSILIGMSISPQLAGFLTIGANVVTNFLGLKAASKWV